MDATASNNTKEVNVMAWCNYYGTSLCDDSCSSYRDCPIDREIEERIEQEEYLKRLAEQIKTQKA